MNLSRRQLLGGGGSLLVAGYLSAFAWGHRPYGTTTLTAAFEALLPVEADAAALAAGVEAFVRKGDPVLAGQLNAALVVLEHLGGAGPLTFRRFSRLPKSERLQIIDDWRASSTVTKRQIADAVRRTALFTWYSQPESWSSIGYEGPWVKR